MYFNWFAIEFYRFWNLFSVSHQCPIDFHWLPIHFTKFHRFWWILSDRCWISLIFTAFYLFSLWVPIYFTKFQRFWWILLDRYWISMIFTAFYLFFCAFPLISIGFPWILVNFAIFGSPELTFSRILESGPRILEPGPRILKHFGVGRASFYLFYLSIFIYFYLFPLIFIDFLNFFDFHVFFIFLLFFPSLPKDDCFPTSKTGRN